MFTFLIIYAVIGVVVGSVLAYAIGFEELRSSLLNCAVVVASALLWPIFLTTVIYIYYRGTWK